MIYVLNAFSPNMLEGNGIDIYFEGIDINRLKTLLKEGFISAVGHQSTAELITRLTGVHIPCERKEVTLHPGDRGVVVTLSFRPEEGRIYSLEELTKLLEERKIKAYYFYVVG